MKKGLNLLFLLLGCLSLNATHIVGGDLHYEYLGNDEYLVVLKVYRDCGTSSSGFDNVADVGVYLGTTLQFTIPMALSDAETSFLPIDTGDPCLDPPEGLCVAEAIYSEVVEIPYQPGTFHLSYQRCCRNTTLINCESNDDIGMTVTTQIPDQDIWGENSTPDFVNFPPVIICLNEPFVFDHSATEPDGDSLVYKMCNPLLTNVAGFEINEPGPPPYPELEFYPEYDFEYPIDAAPAFSIDPVTGLLTGTPTQLGQYVIGICVEEYRNGELMTSTNRDFQLNIAACSQGIIAAVPEEEPCQGLEIAFENNSVGELYLWDFGVEGIESDTSDLFEPTFIYPDSGTYVVTLIVNPGFACADTTTMELSVYDELTADFEAIDDYCEDGIRHLMFQANGNYTQFADFEWNFDSGNPDTADEETTPFIGWSEAGNYDVTMTVMDHGCELSVTYPFEIDPTPNASIAPQTVFCNGLTIEFTNLSTNAEEFIWDFGEVGTDDISLEENPTHTYFDYGEYQVLLFADQETECWDSDTVTVIVLPPDPIDFDFEISPPDLCDSTNVVYMNFTGTGADSLVWDMGDGDFVTGNPANYQYEEPGLYTVTLSAEQTFCDYVETESVDIFYGVQAIDQPVRIPNVFSPNNDQRNDRFRVFYPGEQVTSNLFPPGYAVFDFLEVFDMKIYNRWGNLIHDSSVDGNIWDGDIDGEPVADGTYYYIITYQRACLDDVPTTKHGHVELLREK